MSEMETVKLPEGWEPFEKLKTILAEKGEARVYFVSVECRGLPGIRETKKMQKWLDGIIQWADDSLKLVQVNAPYHGENVWVPAIKARIKNPEDFARIWWSLSKLTNSSCGCSLMVNDAQGYDVRVMETTKLTYRERAV